MQILFIVFASAITIQLIFFVLFLIAFGRKPKGKQSDSRPPVSVIICAHDEELNLKELIPILLDQEYPNFEIIIVNDRSNDNTFDWLIAETKRDHRLRMVHVNRLPEHVTGKKYALTLGIRAATYDWLLLTDADCRPQTPYWIRETSNHFNDSTQFVLGFSPYIKNAGFLNRFIRFESLHTAIQYLSFGMLGLPYMGVGRNLAYRKSFFMQNKGFTNMLHVTGGDDDLYVNRHATGTNTAVSIGADAMVRSVPKATWKEFFRQKVRHLSVGQKYNAGFRFILGIFMLSSLVTWFVGLPLLGFESIAPWVAGLIAFRLLMLTTVFYSSTKKLEERFEWWLAPVLDFVFSIYYISTGLAALLTKKVRWKKN